MEINVKGYKINLNAVQKFWPVKFILIAPESTRVTTKKSSTAEHFVSFKASRGEIFDWNLIQIFLYVSPFRWEEP